ncbi:hypothetical protein K432DRAFT_442840 [Lepidopterella palustris CBS 459.81]|uniref:Uncharacterized protein n=1 Tax=Lepidopterella palustris CBS 459.81 TaxID=1314670 RepID=A0A8E2JFP1_9PEZI|nr:hypothetical protein K432DRAFT_442840 [Lepidopterella palustris CBS 459.81]
MPPNAFWNNLEGALVHQSEERGGHTAYRWQYGYQGARRRFEFAIRVRDTQVIDFYSTRLAKYNRPNCSTNISRTLNRRMLKSTFPNSTAIIPAHGNHIQATSPVSTMPLVNEDTSPSGTSNEEQTCPISTSSPQSPLCVSTRHSVPPAKPSATPSDRVKSRKPLPEPQPSALEVHQDPSPTVTFSTTRFLRNMSIASAPNLLSPTPDRGTWWDKAWQQSKSSWYSCCSSTFLESTAQVSPSGRRHTAKLVLIKTWAVQQPQQELAPDTSQDQQPKSSLHSQASLYLQQQPETTTDDEHQHRCSGSSKCDGNASSPSSNHSAQRSSSTASRSKRRDHKEERKSTDSTRPIPNRAAQLIREVEEKSSLLPRSRCRPSGESLTCPLHYVQQPEGDTPRSRYPRPSSSAALEGLYYKSSSQLVSSRFSRSSKSGSSGQGCRRMLREGFRRVCRALSAISPRNCFTKDCRETEVRNHHHLDPDQRSVELTVLPTMPITEIQQTSFTRPQDMESVPPRPARRRLRRKKRRFDLRESQNCQDWSRCKPSWSPPEPGSRQASLERSLLQHHDRQPEQRYDYQQDDFGQDDMLQDSPQKDDSQQDCFQQNDIQQDHFYKGGSHQNDLQQEDIYQDAPPLHDIYQDDHQKHYLQQDPYQYNFLQDGFHQDGFHQDGFHQDGFHQDGFHQDGFHQDGFHQDDFPQYHLQLCPPSLRSNSQNSNLTDREVRFLRERSNPYFTYTEPCNPLSSKSQPRHSPSTSIYPSLTVLSNDKRSLPSSHNALGGYMQGGETPSYPSSTATTIFHHPNSLQLSSRLASFRFTKPYTPSDHPSFLRSLVELNNTDLLSVGTSTRTGTGTANNTSEPSLEDTVHAVNLVCAKNDIQRAQGLRYEALRTLYDSRNSGDGVWGPRLEEVEGLVLRANEIVREANRRARRMRDRGQEGRRWGDGTDKSWAEDEDEDVDADGQTNRSQEREKALEALQQRRRGQTTRFSHIYPSALPFLEGRPPRSVGMSEREMERVAEMELQATSTAKVEWRRRKKEMEVMDEGGWEEIVRRAKGQAESVREVRERRRG